MVHLFHNKLSRKVQRFTENKIFSHLLAAFHCKPFGISLKVVFGPSTCLDLDENSCEADDDGEPVTGGGAIAVASFPQHFFTKYIIYII